MKKIAIIGAGISGLFFANLLKNNSEYDFTIFEKRIKKLNSVNWRSKLNYFSFHLPNPIFTSFRNSILKR
jgi:salicylate hydroxylase